MPTQTSNNKTINQPPTNNPQWIFENQQSSTQSKHIGFVYLIINHTTRKFYIGKKTFSKYWERYTGSSTTLNKDIQQGNLISKHIIHLCSSKSELSFMELFLQISTNAFLSPNYYNEYIHIRTSTKHLHIPEDTLKQSQQTVRRIIGKIPQ